MKITGTNKLIDLWHELQIKKAIQPKPYSPFVKKKLIEIYNRYRDLGGNKIDNEVEEWIKCSNI